MANRIFTWLNLLFGVTGVALSVAMLPEGGATTLFGIFRTLAALALVGSGVMLYKQQHDRGRQLAVGHAVAWIALNAAEPGIMGYPWHFALIGSVFPAILLVWVGSSRQASEALS